MIGDAAMLVSTDGRALFQALQSLLAAIEAHDDLPSASAGLAQGPALTRSGDWHGRTVILASRLADLAPPGGVLATREMRDALEDGREWSATGVRRLKGVESEVEVFQLRPNAS